MKSLSKIQSEFDNTQFDLEHESDMVQSRLLSPIIEAIEKEGLTQAELAERTGLKQPFISAILNVRKKLNMEHIALFQKALGIVVQPPEVLSVKDHKSKYYSEEEYEASTILIFEEISHLHYTKSIETYSHGDKKIAYTNRKLGFGSIAIKTKENVSDYGSKALAI